MEKLGIQEFINSSGARISKGYANGVIGGVSTDSRTIKRNDLFFALKGPNYDGHKFIGTAFKKGACGVVVEKKVIDRTYNGKPILAVKSVLDSLHRFAHFYRKRFKVKVIGITGSCGKTIVKDMTAVILSSKYNVLATKGNYNNLIGLPLTIFNIDKNTEVVVLEMGTNHMGEIKRLAEISEPQIGVIINIGRAHLEFFGNLENVLKAKMELINALPSNGVAILNCDDPYLQSIIKKRRGKRTITFGFGSDSEVSGYGINQTKTELKFSLKILDRRTAISFKGLGRHLVSDALAACSVGHLFEIPLNQMSATLRNFKLPPGRVQLKRYRKGYIVDDSYNANPNSTRAVVELLWELFPDDRKVIILGDMLELGKKGEVLHKEVGRFIGSGKGVILFTIGREASAIAEGAKLEGMDSDSVYEFIDKKRAMEKLKHILRPKDVILVKGSHALHLEEVTNEIMKWK